MKKAEVKFIIKDERTGQKMSIKFNSVETIDTLISSLQAARSELSKKILVNAISEQEDVFDREDALCDILGDKAFAKIVYKKIKEEYEELDREDRKFISPLMQFIDNAYKRYMR